MENKYYTPTVEQLLIALIKGENVYDINTKCILKLDQYNIVNSLYTFIKSNDWDSYNGYKINIYNYQLEIQKEIMDKNPTEDELEMYILNRF